MNDDMLAPALRDALCTALLGSASDAIVLCDREGVIRFWNPGAERILGFDAAEAVGHSLDIIIPEAQRARHWAGFHAVMESGRSRYSQGDVLAVPGLRRDGSRVSLEFTILPLRNAKGHLDGMAAILRDVTARFEEIRRLRQRVAELAGGSARGGTVA